MTLSQLIAESPDLYWLLAISHAACLVAGAMLVVITHHTLWVWAHERIRHWRLLYERTAQLRATERSDREAEARNPMDRVHPTGEYEPKFRPTPDWMRKRGPSGW